MCLQHVLALLRLGNHDSDVFYKFKQVLIDKVMFPYSTELVQMDVQGDIEKVCAAHIALDYSLITAIAWGFVEHSDIVFYPTLI